MNGGGSSKMSERVAWNALQTKYVSHFYCKSFSQAWVSDVSGNLMLLKTQNQEIRMQNQEMKEELNNLKDTVHTLLAEKK